MTSSVLCPAMGQGVITFQRERGGPLTVRDVLYIPRLRKNMIFVSTLEDKGYEVFFQDGKVLIRPKN